MRGKTDPITTERFPGIVVAAVIIVIINTGTLTHIKKKNFKKTVKMLSKSAKTI